MKLSRNFTYIFVVARTCSLIYIVLDVLKPLQHKKLIEYEVEGFGIRLNKKPPNISFRKKDKGGINLTATVGIFYFGGSNCLVGNTLECVCLHICICI